MYSYIKQIWSHWNNSKIVFDINGVHYIYSFKDNKVIKISDMIESNGIDIRDIYIGCYDYVRDTIEFLFIVDSVGNLYTIEYNQHKQIYNNWDNIDLYGKKIKEVYRSYDYCKLVLVTVCGNIFIISVNACDEYIVPKYIECNGCMHDVVKIIAFYGNTFVTLHKNGNVYRNGNEFDTRELIMENIKNIEKIPIRQSEIVNGSYKSTNCYGLINNNNRLSIYVLFKNGYKLIEPFPNFRVVGTNRTGRSRGIFVMDNIVTKERGLYEIVNLKLDFECSLNCLGTLEAFGALDIANILPDQFSVITDSSIRCLNKFHELLCEYKFGKETKVVNCFSIRWLYIIFLDSGDILTKTYENSTIRKVENFKAYTSAPTLFKQCSRIVMENKDLMEESHKLCRDIRKYF